MRPYHAPQAQPRETHMVASSTRRQFLLGAAATGGLAALGPATAQAAGHGHRPVHASVVVLNGCVFTGDGQRGRLEAVAVDANGTILDVGTTAALRRMVGRGTQV